MRTVPEGFQFKGGFRLFGYEATLELLLSTERFKINVTLPVFTFAGILKVRRSLEPEKGKGMLGPICMMDIGPDYRRIHIEGTYNLIYRRNF